MTSLDENGSFGIHANEMLSDTEIFIAVFRIEGGVITVINHVKKIVQMDVTGRPLKFNFHLDDNSDSCIMEHINRR